MLKLSTKRLRFERYDMSDLQNVIQLVTNPEIMKYIGDGNVKDETYAVQLIERMQQQYKNFDDYGLHKLIHKDTGAFIGHAGIVAQIIDDAFELELGYWIEQEFWGNGYAFEAAQALANYANKEMWLERYVSAIQVGNEASKAIALKNGMAIEKIIKMEGKQVEIYVKLNEFEEDE
ncbi:N-acetyltransferase [Lysinibacillus sp. 2017]|uniref:GNAT family N-acetyltransferase n=1 Tax=unclassified Lysinibacillus TaxID=2636778 RepID=UPI000D528C31|nr:MULTISPECIES: GNAT family N-acetyltransferase [unclassified Lysinibacillus]AWE07517.1 N-acetyltransferase [Lysinibacillus sp. 2017]TGN36679.1 N-acetyltransferase [Lysinibacillus sp. S2017]